MRPEGRDVPPFLHLTGLFWCLDYTIRSKHNRPRSLSQVSRFSSSRCYSGWVLGCPVAPQLRCFGCPPTLPGWGTPMNTCHCVFHPDTGNLLSLRQRTRPDLQSCDRRHSCCSAPGGPHIFLEELNTDINLVSSLEGHILHSDSGDQRGLLYVEAEMGGSEGSPKACFLELEVCPPVGTAKFSPL